MMSEEHSENGRINDQGVEEVSTDVPTPDINSPRQSVTTPPQFNNQEEPAMEFFGQKGGGGSETGSEGDSPRTQDNVSHHSRSYVTVSPSVSPGEWEGLVGREGAPSPWGSGLQGGSQFPCHCVPLGQSS